MKCNEQPSQATETPSVEKHAHPLRVVYCAIYANSNGRAKPQKPRRCKSMPLVVYCAIYSTFLDSQSFEFEICILQALNMPLIRCTIVFFQGRLSRHTTSPSEKTRPESWPGDYMGNATPIWQLSSSHRCHQM